jgi:hypothetical protein
VGQISILHMGGVLNRLEYVAAFIFSAAAKLK